HQVGHGYGLAHHDHGSFSIELSVSELFMQLRRGPIDASTHRFSLSDDPKGGPIFALSSAPVATA
ncbi:MAG: hypothetical protein KJ961_09250, partial [Alphaproteobacteria bacterium]|nr:hypothetical protein [Alphaproteobacteria bacterium]